MIGQKRLHYKLLEELGRGGMGVVYTAEDTKLDRTVAIKFLPKHIASNEEARKRFEREAKAAAALNHPNIATIHAIEEQDDEMFIVMEYIEGRELADLVRTAGQSPLPFADAINYATQIASGLQSAHEKGIVHRDIKSSNIMITDKGQVKIMDFGLAKVVDGLQLTEEYSTLGTAPYMSPEQTRGELVDHRTDIWSFGVLLYEMLTGEMPFKGDHLQTVLYSILNEEPERHIELGPELEHIVAKLLDKKKEQRYQQAQDVLADLKVVNRENHHRRVKADPGEQIQGLHQGKGTS